ncbi:MAG: sulfide/dihydroorotate dehydrogenase-like FAD/NAD-binding protein [Firmicutes bacterium]|nr:sulfide/dihydroorotate dehydrogenase-like FAD/NAD-binding protein [Bacillota bacterium]
MYKILEKNILNTNTIMLKVLAPRIASHCLPGQFIILKVNEKSERVPFTIADFDRTNGSVTIIFQVIGHSTKLLETLNVNDNILDFCGPLGVPSHLEKKDTVIIGGGLGCAIAYPQAKALFTMGANVDIIAGFRNKELIILEKEMKASCKNLYVVTDDGSYGEKGFVTNKLDKLLAAGKKYSQALVIGPLIMMKFVCQLTKKYNLKTVVSMNSIMVDGTGMCGCCRVQVDGKTKFACVDGPDFDGHLVDFDEAITRSKIYLAQEKESYDKDCNLFK